VDSGIGDVGVVAAGGPAASLDRVGRAKLSTQSRIRGSGTWLPLDWSKHRSRHHLSSVIRA
jgi:hypothetical protein